MVMGAVVTDGKDNVATATNDLPQGTMVKMFVGEEELEIVVKESIPFGHKFAIRNISPGEHVLKYAESIGVASKNILIGEHVHVKNVESARGRGDL